MDELDIKKLEELLQQQGNGRPNDPAMANPSDISIEEQGDLEIPKSGLSGDENDPSQSSALMPVSESPMVASNGPSMPPIPQGEEEQSPALSPSEMPASRDIASNSSNKPITREDVMAQLRQKYGMDQDQNKQDLKSAQLRSGIATTLGNISAGARQAGMGMAGLNYTPDKESEAKYAAMAKQPMEHLMQKRALQQEGMAKEAQVSKAAEEQLANDPNSALSHGVQQMYSRLLAQAGASPDQVESLKQMSASEIATYGKSPAQVAAKLKTSLDMKQAAIQAAHERNISSGEGKITKEQTKSAIDVGNNLERMRGASPAVQQAEKDLYSVEKAENLANLYGDPNKLSQQQADLYVSEIAKIATGGVPTEAEMKSLKSGSAVGKIAKVWSQISNEPEPANAGAFIKSFQDYSKSLKKDAQNTIQDRYGRILESNKRHLNPIDYQILEDKYINRFKHKPSSNKEASAESVAMIDPKGIKRMIPKDQVEAAKAAGGKLAE